MLAILVLAMMAAPDDAGFRAEKQRELVAKDGPLSIVGRIEIGKGVSTIGRESGSKIALEVAAAPAKLGTVEWDGAKARFRAEPGVAVTIDGKPGTEKTIETQADKDVRLKVQSGPLELGFMWAHHSQAFYVRVFDQEAGARMKPAARAWYAVDKRYRVEAEWRAAKPGEVMTLPRADGVRTDFKIAGVASFVLNGQRLELTAIDSEGKLFFTFKDKTAPRETYGAGRFLEGEMGANGRVVLDFNKAYNMNCAFAPWWSCVLPPKQNVVAVRIEAGEKKWPGAAH